MKSKKKFLAAISIVLALTLVFAGQIVSRTQAEAFEIFFVEDLLQDEEYMLAVEEYLILQYGEEFWTNLEGARANDAAIMSFFGRARTGIPMYPDFFGGIYYTPEGNMVLQIVQDYASRNLAQYSLVRDFLTTAEGVIVEYVDFSYNEINATMDFLGAMMVSEGRSEALNNVQTIAVDTSNNKVIIWLHNYSEEAVAYFRETVINSQFITFAESVGLSTFLSCVPPSDPEPPPPAQIRPGGRIDTANQSRRGSIGYGARLSNGTQGFVTSAHTFLSSNFQTLQFPNVYIGTRRVGTISANEWRIGGNIDAAFVRINSDAVLTNSWSTAGGIRPSNWVGGWPHQQGAPAGVLRTTVQTTFRQFDRVAKIGSTTAMTIGAVLNPNVIDTIQGISFTQQVSASFDVMAGDSGGVVIWSSVGTLNDAGNLNPATVVSGARNTAGIIMGRAPNTVGVLFNRASNINSHFGLTRFPLS